MRHSSLNGGVYSVVSAARSRFLCCCTLIPLARFNPVYFFCQGFSCRGVELESKWAKIPEGVDILLSHMPPYNVLDLAFDPGSTAKDNPCPVCGETHRR